MKKLLFLLLCLLHCWLRSRHRRWQPRSTCRHRRRRCCGSVRWLVGGVPRGDRGRSPAGTPIPAGYDVWGRPGRAAARLTARQDPAHLPAAFGGRPGVADCDFRRRAQRPGRPRYVTDDLPSFKLDIGGEDLTSVGGGIRSASVLQATTQAWSRNSSSTTTTDSRPGRGTTCSCTAALTGLRSASPRRLRPQGGASGRRSRRQRITPGRPAGSREEARRP